MRSRRPTPAALLCLFFLGSCGLEERYEPPQGPGPWILVDLYHTTIQNPEDYRLVKDNYNYQGTHGYARAFDHLESQGYKWNSLRTLELSAPRLQGYDVLFINLLHEGRPDFEDHEIQAIQDFVRQGGGLFIIADHSNVYYHAQRLNRLLGPMGMEVTYHTAVEPGAASISGQGWIAIDDLTPHPTTEGIETLSFQTGGTMRPTGPNALATARLSREGFGDLWDAGSGDGFYGDWTWNGDLAREPKGQVPVAMAGTYGKGRIVVTGDQNIYGDTWLHYVDNFEHFMNSMEWLAKEEGKALLPLRLTRPVGTNIGIDLKFSDYQPGRGGLLSTYTYLVNFNRDPQVTAKGIRRFDPDDDVLILPSPVQELGPGEVDEVKAYLRRGKRVVVQCDIATLAGGNGRATRRLLSDLAPELQVEISGKPIDFSAPDPQIEAAFGALTDSERRGIPGLFEIQSTRLKTSGLRLAGWHTTGQDTPPEPFMRDVHTDWGTPLFWGVQGARRVEVARSKRVGRGELILILQDRFWRTGVLGVEETAPPPERGEAPMALQFRWIDYLKTPLPACGQQGAQCDPIPPAQRP